jgi:methyl-accepting chemotaxis protein
VKADTGAVPTNEQMESMRQSAESVENMLQSLAQTAEQLRTASEAERLKIEMLGKALRYMSSEVPSKKQFQALVARVDLKADTDEVATSSQFEDLTEVVRRKADVDVVPRQDEFQALSDAMQLKHVELWSLSAAIRDVSKSVGRMPSKEEFEALRDALKLKADLK